jgi:hypothetical protein
LIFLQLEALLVQKEELVLIRESNNAELLNLETKVHALTVDGETAQKVALSFNPVDLPRFGEGEGRTARLY